MLISKRGKNESILIGNGTRITIIGCMAGGTRLAIDAPEQVLVIREELSEAKRTNKHAMFPSTTSVRPLHVVSKQYIFKNGDKEPP